MYPHSLFAAEFMVSFMKKVEAILQLIKHSSWVQKTYIET